MLERLKNLLKKLRAAEDSSSLGDRRSANARIAPPRPSPKQGVPRQHPEYVQADPDLSGEIENIGPGKNVLIRNKFIREDTGTHETLTILDDSLVDSGEAQGIDPYNTGSFDRSKNWDRRHGK
ncbi:MAG: hypothetical protein QNJ11_12980 [Woeseiaceae bacterium]|nr:hypothetical protein [Woeseiaceae bacterium]